MTYYLVQRNTVTASGDTPDFGHVAPDEVVLVDVDTLAAATQRAEKAEAERDEAREERDNAKADAALVRQYHKDCLGPLQQGAALEDAKAAHAAAREEQREAGAKAADGCVTDPAQLLGDGWKHGYAVGRKEAADAVRSTPLTSTPLADENKALRAALETAREALNNLLAEVENERMGYGAFPGGDPRDFHPDEECSTEAEREAWRKACEAAKAGEKDADNLDSAHRFVRTERGFVHIDTGGFGLGTYTHETEAQEQARAALSALDAVKTGAGDVFTREQVKKAIKRHLSSIAGGGIGEDLDRVCDAVKEGKS